MSSRGHCALRAPTVFSVPMKSASVQKTRLWIKTASAWGGLLYKIVDWVRMCFSSVPNRRSARTGRRPRKINHRSSMCSPAYADVGVRPLRAARANPVFRTDEKHIRSENRVMDKSKRGLTLLLA